MRSSSLRPLELRLCLATAACAALSLAVVGCMPSDEGGTAGLGGPGAGVPSAPVSAHPASDWPGGSLGGYAERDGVSVREVAGSGSDGMGDGAMADGAPGAAGPTAGAAEGDRGEVAPGDPPVGPPNGSAGLEGGEIDDNADFGGFLDYLDSALEAYGSDPMVHPVDVAERHIVTVTDGDGRPMPDATVRFLTADDAQTELAWGRTRADGTFAFFPGAYGAHAEKYIVQSEWDQLAARGGLKADEESLTLAYDVALPAAPARLDVAFLIDCTGSMGEEIDRIKATVTDIAGRIAQDPHHPELRFGLVAYRDASDDFVTRTVDFTDDVGAFQGAIDQLEAGGGGDEPEALNEALHEAMRGLSWRQDAATRLAFIVADAPAHFYEQAPYTYDAALRDAATMGVKIFPVASGGSNPIAELQFRQLAQFTLGHFVFITEGGGSPVGSGGSDYNVDPQAFQVERLDDLIVRLVSEELSALDAAE